MKKLIFSTAVFTALLAGTMFMSCQSPEKKVENAQDKLQEAKQDLTEAQKNAYEESRKADNAEAWKAFKADNDQKIKANEAIIAELKEKKKTAGKKVDGAYEEGIANLEEKNNQMKMRMNDYEKYNNNWAAFKSEFNHDMSAIGQALKDITVNNKK